MTDILDPPEGDPFEFIQVEAGNSHSLILNNLGQLFSFGEGLQGQLGQNALILHQNRPAEVAFPCTRKGKWPDFWFEGPKISRIKANSEDSAAFDDEN
jgi:alpha-tubulin suppressor-like RCC1 family protein